MWVLLVGHRVWVLDLGSWALRAGLGCWRVDADSWVPPAGCCCALGAGHFKQLKFGCWVVRSGCWKCLGCPEVPQLQQDRGCGILGTPISPHSPLPQSVQEFHEDLFPDCIGTLPATNAQGWWAGDSQQVSVIRGVSLLVALPPPHAHHCA